MSISFGDVIGESFSWMGKVLFKPFNFKKWITLTFIALMAGYLGSGGGNSNINTPSSYKRDKTTMNEALRPPKIYSPFQEVTVTSAQSECNFEQGALSEETCLFTEDPWEAFLNKIAESPALIVLAGAIAIIFIFLFFLFMWLNARFKFIFLEDIVRNDASIKIPWKENRKESNSLFLFNVILLFCFLAFIALLVLGVLKSLAGKGVFEAGVDVGFWQIMFCVGPYLIIFILFLFLAILLSLVIEDFTLPIMYKNKIKILKALGQSVSLLSKNVGNFLLYILIKIGLGVLAVICTFILFIPIFIILLIIMAICGLIGFGLYKALPTNVHLVLTIVFITIGIPLSICLGFLINCLFLPIPVFFRTFSLKFLAGLDEKYDLFKLA